MNQKIFDIKHNLEEKLDKIKRLESIIAFLRLIFVALVVIFILLGYFMDITIFYILGGILIIPFLISIFVHKKYYNIDKFISGKISAINDYERRYKGTYQSFKDDGMEFMDKENYILDDLDIFGQSSLYKYLNVSKTGMGRKRFAYALMDKDIDKDEIIKRQDATSELASDIDLNISLISRLKIYGENGINKPGRMESALSSIEAPISYESYKIIPSILIFISFVITIILASLKIIKPYYVIIPLILNYFITKLLAPKIKDVRSSLTPINDLFMGYDGIIKEIISHEYKSAYLKEIKSNMSEKDAKGLNKLNMIEPWITSGNNPLFGIIFNSIFGIDSVLVLLYSIWNKKYSSSIRNITSSVADMEMLLSLSTLKISNDNAIIPEISDSFSFKGLAHPLIKQKDVVTNDFNFEGMNIITGSNMSGKTTFMRSIGISYILFKAGGYVVAKEFKAGIYKLFTSMKVTDSVTNGISTFYAEILRIKGIVDYSKKERKMLVLVDEIFKGTNTADRIKGATKVIEALNKPYILSIITTHDFELCETKGAKNYHFKETYEGDKILFDYKIKDGMSETTNAIYLLKMAGIIKE